MGGAGYLPAALNLFFAMRYPLARQAVRPNLPIEPESTPTS